MVIVYIVFAIIILISFITGIILAIVESKKSMETVNYSSSEVNTLKEKSVDGNINSIVNNSTNSNNINDQLNNHSDKTKFVNDNMVGKLNVVEELDVKQRDKQGNEPINNQNAEQVDNYLQEEEII